MPKKLIFDINEIEKIDFKILMAYVHDNRHFVTKTSMFLH